MPELPEVQTLVNDLNAAGLVGRTVTAARIYWPKTVATPSPAVFCRRIKGRVIRGIDRRGKFLIFRCEPEVHLLIHLRMSGRLHLLPPRTRRSAHEHASISFDKTVQLRFHDTRKFGRIYLVENPADILGQLGPEPLDPEFSLDAFKKMLAGRKRMVKPLLLDQGFIAGLGNIYVDEALWEARLWPQRRSDTLQPNEIRALHRAIPMVLQRGLNNLGTSLGTGKPNFYSVARRKGRNQDRLNVFRRTGDPCTRCRTPIRRIIVGQRSTHICPKCQK